MSATGLNVSSFVYTVLLHSSAMLHILAITVTPKNILIFTINYFAHFDVMWSIILNQHCVDMVYTVMCSLKFSCLVFITLYYVM